MSLILSGDIGGTKTLLQIGERGSSVAIITKKFSSAESASLEEMIETLLKEAGIREVKSAAFALAGPVAGRKVQLTNLSWEVDGDAIESRFGIERVELLNDFAAAGYGLEALQPHDLHSLQAGEAQHDGVRLLVGAGTGLGVAWLTQHAGRYQVHASEGGHIDFSPSDEMQCMLLRYLLQQHEHVSYERIVSGMGLLAIFDFMRQNGVAEPSSRMLAAMAENDPAAVISQFAYHEHEPIARLVMELFFDCYGAFTGNLALASLPRGGVYIAGGIAAKLHEQLAQSRFMAAFHAKGRFASLMQSLPVHVVLNEHLGLMGASLIASRL